MGERLHWNAIRQRYPNEWVAIADFPQQSFDPYGDIEGEVVAHHADKEAFYQEIARLPRTMNPIDLRYTGPLFPESDTPLLWQISTTSSTATSRS